ncbi:hypothetical protein BDV12DRAFT_177512 [Aspergillus spectabilis]
MATLPPEIWGQISLQLEKRELSALSRTSRHYHEIVSPFFYRSLRIQFRNLETLRKAVNVIFDRTGQLFLKYARTLDIVCLQPMWMDTEKSYHLWGIKDWGMEYVHWEEPATISNAFLGPQLRSSTGDRGLGLLLNELGVYHSSDWAPIRELISRLDRLEELNFVAEDTPFDSTLLEAVTAHHPACCVNIWSLQDMEDSRRTPTKRDESRFNFNDLQSKALRTLAVKLNSNFSDQDGYDDVDEILPFLFTAPNLKHLVISIIYSPKSDIEQSNCEWENTARVIHPTPIAPLESLTFLDHGSPVYLLPRLARIIDVSCLRSLDITLSSDIHLFLKFTSDLTSLERLFIGVSPLRLPDMLTTHNYTDNDEAISAVVAVRPLKYLCVRGLREASNLHLIAAHHGSTLRGLSLELYARDHDIGPVYGSYKYPELSRSDIQLLATSCPNLEELRLQLRRTEGSTQECNIYRAFGHFPKLRTLILDLHFDPRERGVDPDMLHTMSPIYNMDQEKEEDKVNPVFFRTTLINAAIDKALALGIWNLVVFSQPSHCLRNLRIVPFGHEMYPMDVRFYLIFLARPFLISRFGAEDPVVEEIGKMAWKVWQEDVYGAVGRCKLPRGAYEVIESLWPAIAAHDDWSTGWASLPLETGSN